MKDAQGNYQPTEEQLNKMVELQNSGYLWNINKSMSYAAVVLEKEDDVWAFSFDDQIHHNPGVHTIKTT